MTPTNEPKPRPKQSLSDVLREFAEILTCEGRQQRAAEVFEAANRLDSPPEATELSKRLRLGAGANRHSGRGAQGSFDGQVMYLNHMQMHADQFAKAAKLEDEAAETIDRQAAELAQIKPQCELVHSRCGACGCAIHSDGGCNCEDNRKHPIWKMERDKLTKARLEIARLRGVETADVPKVEDLESELSEARSLLLGGIAGCTNPTHWTETVRDFLSRTPASPPFLTDAQLDEYARKNPPPQEWYDDDGNRPFDAKPVSASPPAEPAGGATCGAMSGLEIYDRMMSENCSWEDSCDKLSAHIWPKREVPAIEGARERA